MLVINVKLGIHENILVWTTTTTTPWGRKHPAYGTGGDFSRLLTLISSTVNTSDNKRYATYSPSITTLSPLHSYETH